MPLNCNFDFQVINSLDIEKCFQDAKELTEVKIDRSTTTAGNMVGTYIKFTPFTGTDSMMKNGVPQTIQTKHHCITCMKEYETKSLEELRFEDYTVGRKGGAQGISF